MTILHDRYHVEKKCLRFSGVEIHLKIERFSFTSMVRDAYILLFTYFGSGNFI